jgi:hypothetical protein
VHENTKLNILRRHNLNQLASVLSQLARFAHYGDYQDYYSRNHPTLLGDMVFEGILVERALMRVDAQTDVSFGIPFEVVPDVIQWLDERMAGPGDPFPTMTSRIGAKKASPCQLTESICRIYGILFDEIKDAERDRQVVLALIEADIGQHEITCLPVGVALPLCRILVQCRERPPSGLSANAYRLIGLLLNDKCEFRS